MIKVLNPCVVPDFDNLIKGMPTDRRMFVDKNLEIVNRIYYLLEKKGITQRDLAVMMDKNESEVSRMLSGMHNITLRTISKIEAALNEKIIDIPK